MNGMTSQHMHLHTPGAWIFSDFVCYSMLVVCVTLFVCVGFSISTNFVHTVAYNVHLCLVNSNARYSSKSTLQVPVYVV